MLYVYIYVILLYLYAAALSLIYKDVLNINIPSFLAKKKGRKSTRSSSNLTPEIASLLSDAEMSYVNGDDVKVTYYYGCNI
jgi:hypothetical protein